MARKKKTLATATEIVASPSTPIKKARVYKSRARKTPVNVKEDEVKVFEAPLDTLTPKEARDLLHAELPKQSFSKDASSDTRYVEPTGADLASVWKNLDEDGNEVLDTRLDDELARSHQVAHREVLRQLKEKELHNPPPVKPKSILPSQHILPEQVEGDSNSTLWAFRHSDHPVTRQGSGLSTHDQESNRAPVPSANDTAPNQVPLQSTRHAAPGLVQVQATKQTPFEQSSTQTIQHDTPPLPPGAEESSTGNVAPMAVMQAKSKQNLKPMTSARYIDQVMPQTRKPEHLKLRLDTTFTAPMDSSTPGLNADTLQSYIPEQSGRRPTPWKLASREGLLYDATDKMVSVSKHMGVRDYLVAPWLGGEGYWLDKDVMSGYCGEKRVFKHGGGESRVEPLLGYEEGLALLDGFYGP